MKAAHSNPHHPVAVGATPPRERRGELVPPLLFKEGWHAQHDGVVSRPNFGTDLIIRVAHHEAPEEMSVCPQFVCGFVAAATIFAISPNRMPADPEPRS